MNLALRIFLIAGLSAISQTYFPWWSGVLVALLVELTLGKKDATAFFSGFYGLAIPWMILSTYIDIKSDSILTMKILDLFKMPQYAIVMIVLTGLVGGLAGGIGSLSGGWIKAAIARTDE